MRASKGRLLVEVDMAQKEELVITGKNGEKIKLYYGVKYDASENNSKKKNPVICKVIDNGSDFEYIKPGDTLIVHHNYCDNIITNTNYCFTDEKSGNAIFSIPAGKDIYAKIVDGELQPICYNIIVERVHKKIESNLIIIPYDIIRKEVVAVKILSVAPDAHNAKVGDTVLTLPMADCEIIYNLNGEEKRFIKVFTGSPKKGDVPEYESEIIGKINKDEFFYEIDTSTNKIIKTQYHHFPVFFKTEEEAENYIKNER